MGTSNFSGLATSGTLAVTGASTLTGDVTCSGAVSVGTTLTRTSAALTLGVGAATFAVTASTMVVTADGGGNTVTSITGTSAGDEVTIVSGNTGLTITAAAGALNTAAGNFVSNGANDLLELVNVGGTLVEKTRSLNT